MNTNFLDRFALALIACLTLAACVAPEVEEARVQAENTSGEIARLRPEGTPSRYDTLRIVPRPYLGLERIDRGPAPTDLPERLRHPNRISLPLTGTLTPETLAGRIQAATGLPVRLVGRDETAVDADVFRAVSQDSRLDAAWTGGLGEFLDQWTQAAGYDWRYEARDGRIDIIRRRAVTFNIHALAGSQSYQTKAVAGGEQGDGTIGSSVSDAIAGEVTYDIWAEVEEQIAILVGPDARTAVLPNSAAVSITGTPAEIARVRQYIEHLNEVTLRPVMVSVHVYAVEIDREADFDLNFVLTLEELFGSSLGLSVATTAGSNTIGLIESDSLANSLESTLKALRKAGTVARLLTATLTTQNGRPTQYFNSTNEAYLKEASTSISEGGIVTTELIPGVISSGASVSLVPRITGHDEVLLAGQIALQDPPSFTEIQSNDTTLQLPEFATRAVQIQNRVRRGQTLVITGFSDHSSSSGTSGFLTADSLLPAGTQNAVVKRIEGVILLTADIGDPLGITEIEGPAL